MKRCFVVPLAVALGCSCHRTPAPQPRPPAVAVAVDPAKQYARIIVVPGDATEALRESIADARASLSTVTGTEFRVESATGAARGVVLLRTSSPDVPQEISERLKGSGPEAFALRGEAERLLLVANTDLGLAHGLYEYLRRLGCRWFFPGEDWAVIPRREDVRLKVDTLVAPAFESRTFFGTGGFGNPIPIDPHLASRKIWDEWKRRNGYGGSFTIGGHIGEAFNAVHKAELLAHPEYLAMVDGKRVPWSPGAKLCVSNASAAQLFVADRVAAAKAAPKQFAVTVEPADGSGFCECERCRAIGSGSVSDQIFYLANKVARAVAQVAPAVKVSLLAYATHASLPAFPLEPNVYVVVVPEAWQRSTLSPDELLEAWAKFQRPLGVSTYWAIPDATNDLPVFDWRNTPRESIRKWHRYGVSNVALETSSGIGTMGLGLYIASRLFWDPNADDAAIAGEFFTLAFKGAAPPMRRMLERWAAEFMSIGHELGLSYADLREARRLAAGDPEVTRRIEAFEQYVHYVRLWLEYAGTPKGAPERLARARAVLVWVSRIQPASMVSSYRMSRLVLFRGESDPGLRADFAPGQWKTEGWQAASTPVPPAELQRLLEDGRTTHPFLDIERRHFSNKLVPLRPSPGASKATPEAMRFIGPAEFLLEVPAGRSSLDFEIAVSAMSKGKLPGDMVTMTAPDGSVVHRELIPPDGVQRRIEVPTSLPGRYRFRVEDQKASFLFRPPTGVPMAFTWFMSADLSPPLYFFVPKGLKRLAFYGWSAAPIQLADADGHPVPIERSALTLAEVPAGQDGRVWSVRHYKSSESIRMLNAPQSFSLAPDTVMVPEEIAP